MTDESHRHHRNGLTRWAVTIFLSGLVSGSALLLVWDRGRIAGDAQDALKKATRNEMSIAVASAKVSAELSAVSDRLDRLEAGQKAILKAVN